MPENDLDSDVKSIIEVEEVSITTQDYGEASQDSKTTGVFVRSSRDMNSALQNLTSTSSMQTKTAGNLSSYGRMTIPLLISSTESPQSIFRKSKDCKTPLFQQESAEKSKGQQD